MSISPGATEHRFMHLGRRTTAVLLVMLCGVFVLPAGTASAHEEIRLDADGGEHKTGRLDIRRMRFTHTADRVNVRVQMDERWGSWILGIGGAHYVTVRLNPEGPPAYTVNVRYRDGRLVGLVHADSSGEIVGYARVSRPDRYSLRVSVSRRLIRDHGNFMRWSVSSSDGVLKRDDAPNNIQKRFRHGY